MNGSDPSGEGILKRKMFNDRAKLQNNSDLDCIETITTKGIIEGGIFTRGVKTVYSRERGTQVIDITTNNIPSKEIQEEMNAIAKRQIERYEEKYDSLYSFSLDRIPEHFQQEIIKDKTTTIRLKLSDLTYNRNWFCKGRLCSTLIDLLFSCHEYYFLSLIEELARRVDRRPVCPKLFKERELTQHSVYNFHYDTPKLKSLVTDPLENPREVMIYVNYMEYLEPDYFLGNIFKNKKISPCTIGSLFFKAVDALKFLEYCNIVKGKISLSNIYLIMEGDDCRIIFTEYKHAKIVNRNGFQTRMDLYESYRNYFDTNLEVPVEYPQFSQTVPTLDSHFVCPAEYKNKRTLYLPPYVKKCFLGSASDKAVITNHFWLSLYSLAISFLKGYIIYLTNYHSQPGMPTPSYKSNSVMKRLKMLEELEDKDCNTTTLKQHFEETLVYVTDNITVVCNDELSISAINEIVRILSGETKFATNVVLPTTRIPASFIEELKTLEPLENTDDVEPQKPSQYSIHSIVPRFKARKFGNKNHEEKKVIQPQKEDNVGMSYAPKHDRTVENPPIEEKSEEEESSAIVRNPSRVDPSNITLEIKDEEKKSLIEEKSESRIHYQQNEAISHINHEEAKSSYKKNEEIDQYQPEIEKEEKEQDQPETEKGEAKRNEDNPVAVNNEIIDAVSTYNPQIKPRNFGRSSIKEEEEAHPESPQHLKEEESRNEESAHVDVDFSNNPPLSPNSRSDIQFGSAQPSQPLTLGSVYLPPSVKRNPRRVKK
eukprot:TRINITY_DN1459_c0_g1_i1.p1 TRINITY_DN1459_c0_g1~~TRINITY_DN1459_c0_g1_i1.p1  ORF type:complete len:766 (-),score=123.00 TRINITY_DN1459_c0_g1_i1:22-2319(-)